MDDPDLEELRFIDRMNRRRLAQLIRHPDPRDPDHPGPENEDEDEETDQ